MPRIKLTLEYDGTAYVGWQVQPNGPSIQSELERAASTLLGEPTQVASAGRTDAGVHALGMVVALTAGRALPMKAYVQGLNGLLPEDIAVVAAEEVADGFDPRRWSMGKHYRYQIHNRRSRSPLRRRTHWELFSPLSLGPMEEAARSLVGRHDFAAFQASDCQAKGTVRELTRVEVSGTGGDRVQIDVRGTAFLKHMVRNLVGTLVEVGRGKRPVAWVREVLEGRDRTLAGMTAPAQGLCLVEVFYGAGPREKQVSEDDE